jgi:hypothetical protein
MEWTGQAWLVIKGQKVSVSHEFIAMVRVTHPTIPTSQVWSQLLQSVA